VGIELSKRFQYAKEFQYSYGQLKVQIDILPERGVTAYGFAQLS